MRELAVFLSIVLFVSAASADDTVTSGNEAGSFSGRVQSLSMYRDYQQAGNGANSSLGVVLGFETPARRGIEAALAYNYAGDIFEHNKAGMLANDDIHLLNEAWVRFRLGNTRLLLGRKIIEGEVFRADDFRQKARSIEGVHLEIDAFADTRLTLGHATRMSSWIQSGDKRDFRYFGEGSDGITWGESIYSGLKNLEIALFDAYSWDVANVVGARINWRSWRDGALTAYYRHESDVGNGAGHTADAYGISVPLSVGDATIEPGLFAVRGDDLLFQEATTGINHPLGSSMMIFAKQFNGDTDTAYIKAVAKVAGSTFYLLYNHTWQKQRDISGHELNVVLKYPVANRVTVAFKSGIGHLDCTDTDDTSATDTRLFFTYSF